MKRQLAINFQLEEPHKTSTHEPQFAHHCNTAYSTESPLKSPACFVSQAAASLSYAFALSQIRVNQIQ